MSYCRFENTARDLRDCLDAIENGAHTEDLNSYERKYLIKIFNKVIERKIDSWAYVWLYSVWYKNGITITPNFNMINNIGFGSA